MAGSGDLKWHRVRLVASLVARSGQSHDGHMAGRTDTASRRIPATAEVIYLAAYVE